MMITDQISSFVPSPLIGENVSELGERFPDMTHIYDPGSDESDPANSRRGEDRHSRKVFICRLQARILKVRRRSRMYAALGADAVGMSTACEAMAARHAGMTRVRNFLYFQYGKRAYLMKN